MRLIITFCGLLLLRVGFGQGVGIGTIGQDPSTQLDISSGARGILIPRFQALYSNAGGWLNTAVGASALSLNYEGSYNSACGFTALAQNTNDNDYTGLGSSALSSNISGYYNTAVGSGALQQTTNSDYNTAVGYSVGLSMILSWVRAFLTS